MIINVSWPEIKAFAIARNLSIQWVQTNNMYYLAAIDGPVEITAAMPFVSPTPDGSDQQDFETNFQPSGNQSPKAQVQTQFEAINKTLKLFSASGTVGGDGTVTILAQIPGTPGGTDGRWISSGEAFFDITTPGDKVTGVWVVDHDNLLGGGVDAVVGSYTDDAAPTDNQGWFLPPVRGTVKAETIGYYGFAPSGFYFKFTAKKGNGITTGTLFVNLEWATSG